MSTTSSRHDGHRDTHHHHHHHHHHHKHDRYDKDRLSDSHTHSHRDHDRKRTRTRSRTPPPSAKSHLIPVDANAFLTLLASALRLRPECLSMAFIYIHKYHKWLSSTPDVPEDTLDDYTLALAALSLSTKSLESPRRLRELLLPSYSLLHPSSPPLSIPSTHYDTLRATLVTAELLLLRVLSFNIRLPLPYTYLPRLLSKATSGPGFHSASDALDYLPGVEREEIDVVPVEETELGRRVWDIVGEACRDGRVVRGFMGEGSGGGGLVRDLAVACVLVGLEEGGMEVGREWVERVEGRVVWEDVEEAVGEVRRIRERGRGR